VQHAIEAVLERKQQMKLYYFETPNPRKPCAVAKYLNSPVEFVRVDLAKGEHQSTEYLAINPNGKVPALSDGDFNLWESHAIMAYLATKADSELWPQDNARQIDILRLSLSLNFTEHQN
jgi:glutathione S-transferase